MTWYFIFGLLSACSGESKPSSQPDGQDTSASPDTLEPSPEPALGWTGSIEVLVRDESGSPIPDAMVMNGGAVAEDWVWTDAEGRTTLEVTDDEITERYVLAGKEGWFSSGFRVDNDGHDQEMTIVLRFLPEEDNLAYNFQPGGDGSSPNTSECGHCHRTIGDDWSLSAHRESARNPYTWDLYTGSAAAAPDCETLGGQEAEGQLPGEPGQTRLVCYVEQGVLPFLNEDCMADGLGCDHPDKQESLENFGACGDCHSPAVSGGTPGMINLSAIPEFAYNEGVTCDFCHKIKDVVPNGSPGLNGSIELLRPSEETSIVGQEFDPITFGPYPDVIVPIMYGTYKPQYRDSEWCSSCHEYSRGALHPEQAVDQLKWPEGLPIHQTMSEYEAMGDTTLTCQGCHMRVLDEQSSTYNITDLGLNPSMDQGWVRSIGEVRRHDFSPDVGLPGLELSLLETGGQIVADVMVSNSAAGHAIPTGDPLHQYLVLIQAADERGASVPATGGQAIPASGGYAVKGVLGRDVTIQGSEVNFSGLSLQTATKLRLVRPSGLWNDYNGPGLFSGSQLSPEEKGIEIHYVVGEALVSSIDGEELQLAGEIANWQSGDIAYLVSSDHHTAGASGWMFAKILADAEGKPDVSQYQAVDIISDNRILFGQSAQIVSVFELPDSGQLTVTATLIRRRFAAATADQYGWEDFDEAVKVAEESF